MKFSSPTVTDGHPESAIHVTGPGVPVKRAQSDLHIVFFALAAAAFAVYDHFVMIDRYVLIQMACLIVIGIGHINWPRLFEGLLSRLGVILGAMLALYLLMLDPAISNTGGDVNQRRMYFEIAALISYFFVVGYFPALETLRPAAVFLVWFVGASLVGELICNRLDINAISNPNIYAYHMLIFVPFFHIIWARHWSVVLAVVLVLASFSIVMFESRTIFLGLILYLGVYTVWPWFAVARLRLTLGALIFTGVLVAVPYLYLYSPQLLEQESVLNINERVTEKQMLNRLDIWLALVDEIQATPIVGHCSNCSTEFYVAGGMSRHMSSHNTYLEVIFRSGIVGFAFFAGALMEIARRLYRLRFTTYGRIGAAYFCAALWTASAYEFIMFSFLSANLLFWIAIALLLAIGDRVVAAANPALIAEPHQGRASRRDRLFWGSLPDSVAGRLS